MPTNYAGVNTSWVSDVPIPINGDAIDEDILEPVWESLADREAYLNRVRPVVYSVVAATSMPSAATGNSNEITFHGNGGFVDVPVVTGDKVFVKAYITYGIDLNSGGELRVRLRALEAAATTVTGGSTVVPGSTWWPPAGQDMVIRPLTISGVWTAVGTDTPRFVMTYQDLAVTPDQVFTVYNLTIQAIKYPAL